MAKRSGAVDVALTALRVGVGATMVAHGVNHIFGGGKIAGTGRWFGSIGFKAPKAQAWLASVTEIGAGTMLATGTLTPVAAAGVVGPMTVAIATVHKDNGFFIIKEGWEYAATLIAASVALGAAGGGAASVDRVLGLDEKLSGWAGLAIAASGAAVAAGQLAAFWRPEPAEAAQPAPIESAPAVSSNGSAPAPVSADAD